MIGWKTDVLLFDGKVYVRQVGPRDSTPYLADLYASIPWADGKPDQEAVDLAVADAKPVHGGQDDD